MKNIIRVIIIDNDKDRKILKRYKKEVDYQISPGLYTFDPIEGRIQGVWYKNGVFTGDIVREHDLRQDKLNGLIEVKSGH